MYPKTFPVEIDFIFIYFSLLLSIEYKLSLYLKLTIELLELHDKH